MKRAFCVILSALLMSLAFVSCSSDDYNGGYYADEEEVGGDWTTWRAYSEEVEITPDLTISMSTFDDCTGIAIYDASDGSRISEILFDSPTDGYFEYSGDDVDGDGNNELIVTMSDGSSLVYHFDIDDDGYHFTLME